MNTHVTRLAAPREISAQRTVTWHLTLFILILIGALGVSGAVMGHIAALQDEMAREQTRFYAGKALQNRIAASESLIRTYAFWNDAYRYLNPPLNADWAYREDNVGPLLYTANEYEMVCVLNQAGEEYVMRDGQPVRSHCTREMPVNLDELRDAATVAARRDAVVTRYVTLGDQPAIATAALVRPTRANPPLDGPLMIFVDRLTPAKLQKISRDFGLIALQVRADDVRVSDGSAVDLGDSGFELSWRTPTPGSDMLHRMAGVWAAVVVLVFVFLVWLIRASLTNARVVDHYQRSLKSTNQALETSEQRFKAVAEASSDWIWETDESFRLTYLSARFETLTGYRIDDWIGRRIDDLITCDTTSLVAWLEKIPQEGHSTTLTCGFRDAHGLRRICKFTASGAGGLGYRGTSADITHEVEAHARIQHLSLHDALTGLPNRAKLASFMDDLLGSGREEQLAVLMLDLDRFKPINDTLGHPAGDAVLQIVAERLRDSIRGEDLVARLGGDEFVIVDSQSQGRDDAEAFCRRLVAIINQPIEYNGNLLHIGTSIGIVLSGDAQGDAQNLLRCADVAMYEAKTAGRNAWRFYSEHMDLQLKARKRSETELRAALREGQLELYYQPRYRIGDLAIVSAEALLRWNHPSRGLVGPEEFIKLAEESDLIIDIGEWVLAQACREAAGWPGSMLVSVNISPSQFTHADIVSQVKRALVDSGLAAERLELEVTENTMLGDVECALLTMQALKELGVKLNMDDFGTGYSSLGYLRAYPFDSIKIDRRFVATLDTTGRDRSIVQAIIGLGRALNLAVTAEGVETEDQLRILEDEQCGEVQGFLFSEAVDRKSLARLLEKTQVAAG
ncbi:EAL domain-containing protein [Pseudomonas sp. PDM23]|uniref:bifunctional diguanylate cyclase/phosphodiesterase n=1 Tax=unclassified Pseudomonas TaxID=196821 RepID=UPI0017825721|nr:MULTISPECIES: EAL domain-containing protein [unclassified Pseudomonas]MBD9579080.1 EAL domain-containing protein [Pseudomonas sp. PDM23]MBD9672934.1 EAL domain-containing protein [Pseudomonas sp. PDM21]